MSYFTLSVLWFINTCLVLLSSLTCPALRAAVICLHCCVHGFRGVWLRPAVGKEPIAATVALLRESGFSASDLKPAVAERLQREAAANGLALPTAAAQPPPPTEPAGPAAQPPPPPPAEPVGTGLWGAR